MLRSDTCRRVKGDFSVEDRKMQTVQNKKMVFIDEKKVIARIGCSRSHWRVLQESNGAPKPVPVGEKKKMWIEAEIDSYMESLAAKRSN